MPQYIMPHGDSPEFQELDAFTQAYIECAIWSSEEQLCEESESFTMSGAAFTHDNEVVFISGDIGFDSLDSSTVRRMVADCATFQAQHGALFAGNETQAGHDFWLTRNGHGAGFWDGDWPEPYAAQLTKAAKAFGEFNLYVGDDGMVHS